MNQLVTRINRVLRRSARQAQLRLDSPLMHFYQFRQPGRLNRASMFLIKKLRSALILYADGQDGRAQLWEGRSAVTGLPLKVAYIADERANHVRSPEYLQHILFDGGLERVRECEPFPMTKSRRAALELADKADLVIVEQNPLLHWQPPSGAAWRTQPWVRMVFDISPGEPWESVEQRMRGQKNNIKLVKKLDYKLRVSRDEADFDHFYEHMYVPMVRERHQGYGWVENKDGARSMFKRGHLVLIETQDGLPVSGYIHIRHGKLAFAVINGTLNGDQTWHDRGALSALYYLSIRWCHQQGVQRFDSGECRPFQSDGLYSYKARWGMTTVLNPWAMREWMIWSPCATEAAEAWLKAHPLAI